MQVPARGRRVMLVGVIAAVLTATDLLLVSVVEFAPTVSFALVFAIFSAQVGLLGIWLASNRADWPLQSAGAFMLVLWIACASSWDGRKSDDIAILLGSEALAAHLLFMAMRMAGLKLRCPGEPQRSEGEPFAMMLFMVGLSAVAVGVMALLASSFDEAILGAMLGLGVCGATVAALGPSDDRTLRLLGCIAVIAVIWYLGSIWPHVAWVGVTWAITSAALEFGILLVLRRWGFRAAFSPAGSALPTPV